MARFEFEAELWLWDARKGESWAFVSVPEEMSDEIADLAQAVPRAGFGSVKVSVAIGGSEWSTSVFPGDNGCYSLPVKKAVRKKESLEIGDTAQVWLETTEV